MNRTNVPQDHARISGFPLVALVLVHPVAKSAVVTVVRQRRPGTCLTLLANRTSTPRELQRSIRPDYRKALSEREFPRAKNPS